MRGLMKHETDAIFEQLEARCRRTSSSPSGAPCRRSAGRCSDATSPVVEWRTPTSIPLCADDFLYPAIQGEVRENRGVGFLGGADLSGAFVKISFNWKFFPLRGPNRNRGVDHAVGPRRSSKRPTVIGCHRPPRDVSMPRPERPCFDVEPGGKKPSLALAWSINHSLTILRGTVVALFSHSYGSPWGIAAVLADDRDSRGSGCHFQISISSWFMLSTYRAR